MFRDEFTFAVRRRNFCGGVSVRLGQVDGSQGASSWSRTSRVGGSLVGYISRGMYMVANYKYVLWKMEVYVSSEGGILFVPKNVSI